jgi:hypothetical protein
LIIDGVFAANDFTAEGLPLVEAAGIDPEVVVAVVLHDLVSHLGHGRTNQLAAKPVANFINFLRVKLRLAIIS